MNLTNEIMLINSLFSINHLPIFLFFNKEENLLFLASKDARYEIDSLYHNNDNFTKNWLENHKRLIPLYNEIYKTYSNTVYPSIIDNNLVIQPSETEDYITIVPHNKTVDIKTPKTIQKGLKWTNLSKHLQDLPQNTPKIDSKPV